MSCHILHGVIQISFGRSFCFRQCCFITHFIKAFSQLKLFFNVSFSKYDEYERFCGNLLVWLFVLQNVCVPHVELMVPWLPCEPTCKHTCEHMLKVSRTRLHANVVCCFSPGRAGQGSDPERSFSPCVVVSLLCFSFLLNESITPCPPFL